MKKFALLITFCMAAASASGTDPRVYIANNGSNTVTVLNPETLTIEATIPVGQGPIRVALLPDASRLYVANNHTTLSVVDTETLTVIRSIPIENHPSEMVASPDGKRLFVVSRGVQSADGLLSIVDTTTNRVSSTLSIGKKPTSLALSPDGTLVAVATPGSPTMTVIDVATESVAAQIICGFTPRRVYFNLAGDKIYVTNAGSASLTVIDSNTLEATGLIETQELPRGMAFTPDGRIAYVTNVDSASVTAFDVDTNEVLATIPIGTKPWHAEIPPSGDHCFVTESGSGTVSVIDIATQTRVKVLQAGSGAYWGGHYDPMNRFFVTNPDVGTVSVYDTEALVKITDIETGIQPWMLMVYDPGTPPSIEVPNYFTMPLPLNTTTQYDIEGSGFQYGATVSVSPADSGVSADLFFHGPARVSVTVQVADDAELGLYDLTFENPNGQTLTLEDALQVGTDNLPFTVTTVSPTVAFRDPTPGTVTETELSFTGSGFAGPISIEPTPPVPGLTFANVNIVSSSQFTADAVVTSDAELGVYDITLTDGDGETVLIENTLSIADASTNIGLDLTSVSPTELTRNSDGTDNPVTVTLTGTGFDESMSIAVRPFVLGLRVDSVVVVDDTTANVNFTVRSNASLGDRDLEITVGGDSVLATRAVKVISQ